MKEPSSNTRNLLSWYYNPGLILLRLNLIVYRLISQRPDANRLFQPHTFPGIPEQSRCYIPAVNFYMVFILAGHQHPMVIRCNEEMPGMASRGLVSCLGQHAVCRIHAENDQPISLQPCGNIKEPAIARKGYVGTPAGLAGVCLY